MRTSQVDRELLFGALALKMGFIDADELVSAISAWAADKSRPLKELLITRRVIREDESALVESLVNKHLAAHEGDASVSLAGISLAPGIRESLHAIGDGGIDAVLVRLLGVASDVRPATAETPPPVPGATLIAASPPTADDETRPYKPPTAPRFTKLRYHDKGGVGQIWVAQDAEVPREVALKEIQARFADNAGSQERFLIEARITGALEHPGVVPVYGLGHYADGRPFYAMRLIEGDSLQEAIEHFHASSPAGDKRRLRAIEFRRLLRRFMDVCNVIEYAHSRHVVHRDLKPSNIMLGQFGETLVVDWGMAKQLPESDYVSTMHDEPLPLPDEISDASDVTRMGSVVGTPSYMSPEQAAGRLDLIGPASDIYSLGATLYCLLTGHPPFRGGNVLKRVRKGDFPRPSQVTGSVPPPLESICLRAMSRSAKDRYPSSSAVAEDIEKWLADEPVSAHREAWHQRLARWTRRHRAWSQAVAAALIVVTAVSTVAVVVVSGARHNETAAKEEATDMFRLARTATDSLLTRVSDELEAIPGAQPVRRRLLQSAGDSYARLAAVRSNDLALRAELGWSQLRLGEVRRTLGDLPAARDAMRVAVERFTEIAAEAPSLHAYRDGLAHAHTQLGRLLSDLGDHQQAEEHHDRAISLFSELILADPDQRDYLGGRALGRINLGVVYYETGRYRDCVLVYRRAIADLEMLAELQSPALPEPATLFRLARSYNNLALALREIGGADQDVEQAYDNAILHAQSLTDDDLRVPKYLNLLIQSRHNLGDYYVHDRQNFDRALSVFREAAGTCQELVRLNPQIPEFRSGLVAARIGLGEAYGGKQQTVQEENAYRDAIGDGEELLRLNNDLPRYQKLVGQAWYSLGNLQLESGQLDGALEKHTKAIEHLVAAYDRQQGVPEYRVPLWEARERRCYVLLLLQRADEAIDEFDLFHTLLPAEEKNRKERDHQAACFLSRASGIAHKHDDETQADAYAGRALEFVTRAIRAGYDRGALAADEELAPLRDNLTLGARYRQLVEGAADDD